MSVSIFVGPLCALLQHWFLVRISLQECWCFCGTLCNNEFFIQLYSLYSSLWHVCFCLSLWLSFLSYVCHCRPTPISLWLINVYIRTSLLLTSWGLIRDKYGDFSEANGFGPRQRTLNNDEASILRGRCADDGGGLRGSQWSAVLSTERVRRLVDWSSCRRVVVRQPDHKVVQTESYVTVETHPFSSGL